MSNKSLHKVLMELYEDLDGLRDEIGDEIVKRVKRKTFVDTGELRDSWYWDKEGLYTTDQNIPKILANEFGTATMTPSRAVRRTMKELPKIIRTVKRRSKRRSRTKVRGR